MLLGPLVPGLVISLCIMAATLSYGAVTTPLWRRVLSLVGYLVFLAFSLALVPLLLPLYWLVFALQILARCLKPETRKAARVGALGVLICLVAVKLHSAMQDPYASLDHQVIGEHQVSFYARQSRPMGFSSAALVSATAEGPKVRRENAVSLLKAKSLHASPSELTEISRLLESVATDPELKQIYRERLEKL